MNTCEGYYFFVVLFYITVHKLSIFSNSYFKLACSLTRRAKIQNSRGGATIGRTPLAFANALLYGSGGVG